MSALSFLLACSPAIDSAAEDYAEVREAVSDGGSWKIAYLPDPDPVPFNEIFGLEISIESLAGLPVTDLDVTVDATMPEHGHGMNTAPQLSLSDQGQLTVEGMLFHMEGYWELSVLLEASQGSEETLFAIECCQ